MIRYLEYFAAIAALTNVFFMALASPRSLSDGKLELFIYNNFSVAYTINTQSYREKSRQT